MLVAMVEPARGSETVEGPDVPESDSGPDVLTVEQAAELLQLSPKTVKRLSATGVVPGRRVGNQWRYHRATLIDWIAGKDV